MLLFPGATGHSYLLGHDHVGATEEREGRLIISLNHFLFSNYWKRSWIGELHPWSEIKLKPRNSFKMGGKNGKAKCLQNLVTLA